MTSHLNGDEIKKIREQLALIFSEVCVLCNKTPEQLGVENLELHEIRYKRPLDVHNFLFMCHGCNRLKDLRKKAILDRELSASHKKNIESRPLFERWLRTTLQEHNHHYPINEVIDSGAYISDSNIETVKRWIKPLVSDAGPYIIASSEYGKIHIYEKGHEPKKDDLI